MLLGLVIIYAIGPQRANVLNNAFGSDYGDSYFFIKQLISFFLAAGVFALVSVVPHGWITKHGTTVLITGLVACALLAILGWAGASIAPDTNGAVRWFNLGILGSFQPSEILKFGVLIYSAVFLAARAKEGRVNDWKATLLPIGIVTGAALLFIIIIQKDLGTGISLAAIVMTILFAAGVSRKVLAIILGVLMIVGTLFIVTSPHRIERLATYFKGDSTSTSDAESYHIEHAKIAIGSGGLLGVGIGNSVQASGYLPEAINDSVFAILGETFGFIGLAAVIVLFVALLMRLLKVMDHLVDLHLKLLVAGVFGWLGAHVILNIAAMIGIFPLTGITLPLLSYGGTSMIFMTAALGMVYQLSRYTVHPSRLRKEETYENTRGRRGLGRTRDASRRGA